MFSSLLSYAPGLLNAPWWASALILLAMLQLTIVSTTLYLHRSATHRGVDFHPAVSHIFRFWLWLTTATVTKQWVAIHRKHHAHCETENDPHSPHTHGIRAVLWTGAELYQSVKDDQEMLDKYGRGTPDDAIERKLYTPHSNLGIVLLLIINTVLFGVVGVAMWAVQMVWIPFWAAGVINGLGHWWGYRNFDTQDASRNLSPWGVWVGGEELHNNHHAYPSSARFDAKPGEVDAGWLVIVGLRRLGLATVLRVRAPMALRPIPAEPDHQTLQVLLTQRWHIAAEYMRHVVRPHVKENAIKPSWRTWSALRRDGRWTTASMQHRIKALLDDHPSMRDLLERRQKLLAIADLTMNNAQAKHQALVEWCREAEQSGHAHLVAFTQRLKSYTLDASPALVG